MTRDFCIIALWTLFAVIVAVHSKICPSMDIRNDISNLNKLRNCTAIAGNLSIVLLEKVKSPAEYEKYVFNELTEVTEYLLLYKVFHLTSVGTILPNLRVIRGTSLITDYSLAIHHMPHLTQIGLTKLLYIARGDVKVDQCPNICYVDTINWKMIGAQHLHYTNLNNKTCTPCPDFCKGRYCWNVESCQKQDTDKCHQECLDCTVHHSSRHCAACKNFENAGECVAECPPDKYTNKIKSKCMSREECEKSIGGRWWIFRTECVNACPEKYQEVESLEGCKFCGNNCTKICNISGVVDDLAQLQKYKGCTHIKGSLSIRVSHSNVASELEENLGQIRVIEGYLKLSRSNVITSLKFLSNLREIQGKTKENTNHTIFMFENQSLQKLWDFDDDFNLTIGSGTISFHNNPQLCMSEIKRLANLTGLTDSYTSLDVSPYSNGDKSYCNVIDLKIAVRDVTPHNATIKWQKIENESYVGYTVFYTKANKHLNMTYQHTDACDISGWRSFYTSNTSFLIKHLRPYSYYAYYIKVLSSSGGQSPIQYFRTLSDDPELDKNDVSAISYNSSSIMIKWSPPYEANGILAYYQIIVYMEPDFEEFLEQRDFCIHPQVAVKRRAPPILQVTDDNCNCTKEEIHLAKNDVFTLCDDNSISKYGFHGCETFKYDFVSKERPNVTENSRNLINYSRRSENQRKQNEVSSQEEVRIINITDVNATNYSVAGLQHFRIYVFYLTACNHNRTERLQCSGVVQVFNRTLKDPHADDVTIVNVRRQDLSVEVVWFEPTDPNSLIVAYNIEYKKIDTTEGNTETKDCITRRQYNKMMGFKMKDLLSGNYYVRVQAISLAGPGHFSSKYYFTIPYPETSYWIYITVTVLLFLLIAAMVFIYFKYQNKRLIDNVRLITNINPEYEGVNYTKDEWEVERDNVVKGDSIGEGTFGAVFNGYIKNLNLPCAIKTIKDKTSFHEQSEFLNEASTMKKFSDAHHVVKLLGVVSVGQPALVLMELMERGDLKSFLRRCRDSSQNITSNEMYKMAIEIADGMAYLTAKKFVHRDLAARNCMVGADFTVKIGDFGMARDIYQSDYYRKGTKGLLPVRWMAPESLIDGVFTSDSDVWSYGVVLWEIATFAEQPYQGMANEQVLQFVSSRGVLPRPQECSDGLFDIMAACWAWRPMRRPQFLDIIEQLQNRVGPNFSLVSFYHSRDGVDYRLNHRQRMYHPPAMEQAQQSYDDVFSNYRVSDEDVSLHFRTEPRSID